MLLRAAVPEPTRDSGESLRGAPTRPGHSPDASPPHHAPLGCLPGVREAAAPGLYSHERCITTSWWLFCLELTQNAHNPNLPPASSLNSNSSWSGLKWQNCPKAFGCGVGYVSLALRRKPCIYCGRYSIISLPPRK